MELENISEEAAKEWRWNRKNRKSRNCKVRRQIIMLLTTVNLSELILV